MLIFTRIAAKTASVQAELAVRCAADAAKTGFAGKRYFGKEIIIVMRIALRYNFCMKRIAEKRGIALNSITGLTHGKRLSRRVLAYWQIYALLLPAVLYVFVFNYIPMYGVQIAFRQFRTNLGIWNSPWVGLKHFVRFVNYPNFAAIIWNTVALNLYSLATFPCSIVLALLLNELNNLKFKKAVQMITYAPHFISTVVLCSMLTLFLERDTGFLTDLFVSLGFERTNLLMSPGAFRSIYVWSGVWQGVGWGTIIYLSALSGVSTEMVEAARIDGATRPQIILHVNLPTIAPTVVIMLVLSCGSLLSVGFEKIFLLQNDLNLDVSQVVSTYTYEVGIAGGQFSYSAAIGLFNTIVNFLVLTLVNAVSRRISSVSIW